MAIKTFSVGEVLTSTDTNTYLANSGLVYVTSAPATGAQTIVVNNAFNANFDNYRIVWDNLVNNQNQPGLQITLGSSASNYFFAGWYNRYGNFALQADGLNGGGYWNVQNAGTSDRLNGSCDIFNPFNAVPTNYTAVNSSAVYSSNYNGYHSDSTSFTSFTMKISLGTLSTGKVTVYGYRKG